MDMDAVSDGVARLMWAVALLCFQSVGMGCANVSVSYGEPFLVSDRGETREMHYVTVLYDGWRQMMSQDFRSYIGYMDTSVELTPGNAREIMKVIPLRQYPSTVLDISMVFSRSVGTGRELPYEHEVFLLSLEPLVVGYRRDVYRSSSSRPFSYVSTTDSELQIDCVCAATRPWPEDSEYWQVWSDARPDDTYDRELEYQEYLRLFAPVTIELDAPMSARDAIQSRVWEQYLPQQSVGTTASSDDQ